jgi:DNA invertase Pin-like site-specific DNA recombinase
MNPKLTNERLKRRAIVYLRQSSPEQVFHNQESQRRQYGLADQARDLDFRDVLVIDEDLGRTGSGFVERRGFQRLVAEVCTGEVGAVFCIEASRLARNGRDWHHLIWMCGLVGAVLVDFDGVYDPNLVNDRLLLGMKGEMAAFELSLLRQRSLEAIRQKARRGELQFYLPVGFCWSENGKMEMDPDRRIQDSIDLVFNKFTELGSIRQVTLWFRSEKIALPAIPSGRGERRLVWKLPLYHTIWAILTNPLYAGAYAFGKTEATPFEISPPLRQKRTRHRIAEQLPDDGQVGDYRFVRRISTDKRPCVDRSDQLPDGRILFHNPTVCEYVVRTQELRIYRFTADTHFSSIFPCQL